MQSYSTGDETAEEPPISEVWSTNRNLILPYRKRGNWMIQGEIYAKKNDSMMNVI